MRIQNWEKALEDYLASAANGRFRYGTRDCCSFSMGWVKVLTGIDVMAKFKYSNRSEALTILDDLGGIEAGVNKTLTKAGFRQIGPLHACRGDLVIANVPKPTLGVVGTDGWHAVFVAPKATVFVPLSACRLAWRIS